MHHFFDTSGRKNAKINMLVTEQPKIDFVAICSSKNLTSKLRRKAGDVTAPFEAEAPLPSLQISACL